MAERGAETLSKPRVLIVDDEHAMRFALGEVLRTEGYEIQEAVDGQEAVERVREHEFDLVIMDIRMPRLDGMEALKQVRQLRPHLVVVMITAYGNEEIAREAMRLGAYDYFRKPFEIDDLRVVAKRSIERGRLLRQLTVLREELASHRPFDKIIGASPPMREAIRVIEQVAPTDATVLILGDSGTGKELVADAIHRASHRREHPLVKVNCAAIPETLLESELFGHERGAFTGAVAQRVGKFELADRGTIFLDEIGEVPLGLQSKLLRVLQEREIERVGGNRTIGVDVRLLAATNRDLEREMKEGRFREDLFFRLNVVPLRVPSLAERGDDVRLLVQHFLQVYSHRFQKDVVEVSPEALEWCMAYPWPGNVRELENVIQRAVLLTEGSVLGLESLPVGGGGLGHPIANLLDASLLTNFDTGLAEKLDGVTEALEGAIIRAALDRVGGRRQEAADLLGISRKSLFNKMRKYSME